MARVLALHDVSNTVSKALASSLRPVDEAILLPQAHKSDESGLFKNVLFKLDGTAPDLNPNLLSPNMFTGVSAIRVPVELATRLLEDPSARQTALLKMAQTVPSETTNSDLQVGPELDGDEYDRDVKSWTAGFDGPACCVGLYSAQELRAPEEGALGMNRVHDAYYLVCKAGGGVATQTFYSRLVTSLRKHESLDACLLSSGGSPGPSALRRASAAAERNRHRILVLAAKAIGYDALDTVSDNAGPVDTQYRVAIPIINVSFNTLVRCDGDGNRGVWLYTSGCVDTLANLGVILSSNATDGFVAFTDRSGKFKVPIRNQALNCVPFCSERVASNRDAVIKAARIHAGSGCSTRHPDHEWVYKRFLWTDSGDPSGSDPTFEPPCLWGANRSLEGTCAHGTARRAAFRSTPARCTRAQVRSNRKVFYPRGRGSWAWQV
jgi:hypothetical protein